jgi:ADP-heptose:LPS heptosyltransferase
MRGAHAGGSALLPLRAARSILRHDPAETPEERAAMRFGRGLEKAARAAYLNVLAHLTPPPGDPADLRSGAPVRALLYPYDRIGDMVLATALLRNVAPPGGRITLDVLTSPRCAEIVRRQTWQGEVLAPGGGPHRFVAMTARIRRRRYQAIVDTFVSRRRISASRESVMRLSGAPHRVGMAGPENDHVYTLRLPRPEGAHMVEVLATFADAFGVERGTRDWRPSLPLTERDRRAAAGLWAGARGDERGPRFLVNISAGHPSRRWPDARWAAVVRHLRARCAGARVLVIGLPDEAPSLRRIASDVAADRTPGLWESFALVESCDCLVTPDTALVHAASAFGRCTVALLQSDKLAWVPYRTPGRNVVAADSRNLDSIAADRVTEALDALLDDPAGPIRSHHPLVPRP